METYLIIFYINFLGLGNNFGSGQSFDLSAVVEFADSVDSLHSEHVNPAVKSSQDGSGSGNGSGNDRLGELMSHAPSSDALATASPTASSNFGNTLHSASSHHSNVSRSIEVPHGSQRSGEDILQSSEGILMMSGVDNSFSPIEEQKQQPFAEADRIDKILSRSAESSVRLISRGRPSSARVVPPSYSISAARGDGPNNALIKSASATAGLILS